MARVKEKKNRKRERRIKGKKKENVETRVVERVKREGLRKKERGSTHAEYVARR